MQDLEKLRRWASVLRIPEQLLWFRLSRWHDERAPVASLVADAGATAPQSSRAEIEDMNRRELLRLIGVAGATLSTPLDDVTAATAGPDRHLLRTEPVDDLTDLNAQLWQLYDNATVKVSTLPLVRSQLGAVAARIGQTRSQAGRRRLSAALADVLQLAGEISFDGNHYTDAAHCYTLAAAASREAGHYDMWACALVRHSFIPLHSRRFGDALPLLEAASKVAQRGDHQLPTRQWASTVTAQAHAGLGDLRSCREALSTMPRPCTACSLPGTRRGGSDSVVLDSRRNKAPASSSWDSTTKPRTRSPRLSAEVDPRGEPEASPRISR